MSDLEEAMVCFNPCRVDCNFRKVPVPGKSNDFKKTWKTVFPTFRTANSQNLRTARRPFSGGRASTASIDGKHRQQAPPAVESSRIAWQEWP
jgi:hypothetical protein